MLWVQDAGTHRTAQSRILILDTCLTQQAGVVPLPACSRSTLDAHSAVLQSKDNLLLKWWCREWPNLVFLLSSVPLRTSSMTLCVPNFEKDKVPSDQNGRVSGNTHVATRRRPELQGCVWAEFLLCWVRLRAEVQRPFSTYCFGLIRPLQKMFLRGLITSYLNDKQRLSAGWMREVQWYWQVLWQRVCKYIHNKIVWLYCWSEAAMIIQGELFENMICSLDDVYLTVSLKCGSSEAAAWSSD